MVFKLIVPMLAVITLMHTYAAEVPEQFQSEIPKALPDAMRFEEKAPGVFRIRNAAGAEIGTLYLDMLNDDQRKFGYAGTIEVAVLFDAKEEVAGVLIGKNSETPSYIDRIRRSGFLETWNKLKMADIPAKEVDAVSRATYSSEAIKHGVRKLARQYLEEAADAAGERSVEITQLERRVKSLQETVARSAATRKQLETRKDDELKLRFIAAVEGPDAAEKYAKEHDLIYFNRTRHGAPQGTQPNHGPRGGESAYRPQGDPGRPQGRQRGPSPVETAAAAYKADQSEENLAALNAAILADYEKRLSAPPSMRDTEMARALKVAEERLAILKAK